MAETKTTDAQDTAQEDKLYTEEDVKNRVNDRLKNSAMERDRLNAKLAQMQAEKEAHMQQMAEAGQTATAQMPQGAPNPAPEGAPAPMPGATSPDGITQPQMQALLQQQAQQQQTATAQNFHHQSVNKMRQEDPEFDKLAKQAEDPAFPNKIPPAMQIYISNSVHPDHAKKIFTDLLKNENSNLKMNNAFLTNTYDQWLQKTLGSKTDATTSPNPVPDLSEDDNTGESEGDSSAIDDYLKNK